VSIHDFQLEIEIEGDNRRPAQASMTLFGGYLPTGAIRPADPETA
jgi:hypothetical protein